MDSTAVKTSDTVIDIHTSTVNMSKEAVSPLLCTDKIGIIVPCALDGDSSSFSTIDGLSPGYNNDNKKENRKSMSTNKKSPKPPRPPRGLSLDAADRKLIKEISELVRIKRGRIERMKALKRMKEANASSSSSSTPSSFSGNLIAILFGVLVCFLVIFRGCHSSGSSRRIRSSVHVHGALDVNRVEEQRQENFSTT